MRWPRRIMMALAIGGVVNVGVAWGLAWFVPWRPSSTTGFERHSDGYSTWFYHDKHPGLESLLWATRGSKAFPPGTVKAPGWSLVKARDGCKHKVSLGHLEFAAGWPMLSLKCCLAIEINPRQMSAEPKWSALAVRHSSTATSFEPRALPLMPVWPGLVVNFLVFAAVAMCAMVTPGWIVRERRRCRGHCVWCGYPKGNAATCSECGKAST